MNGTLPAVTQEEVSDARVAWWRAARAYDHAWNTYDIGSKRFQRAADRERRTRAHLDNLLYLIGA